MLTGRATGSDRAFAGQPQDDEAFGMPTTEGECRWSVAVVRLYGEACTERVKHTEAVSVAAFSGGVSGSVTIGVCRGEAAVSKLV